jgi:hypothetical protein
MLKLKPIISIAAVIRDKKNKMRDVLNRNLVRYAIKEYVSMATGVAAIAQKTNLSRNIAL